MRFLMNKPLKQIIILIREEESTSLQFWPILLCNPFVFEVHSRLSQYETYAFGPTSTIKVAYFVMNHDLSNADDDVRNLCTFKIQDENEQ
uniref:Uncharacterized protein n=1 Tax=Romanomermis culicivorax TaxID=13658 RepID=A0A915J579_ROMCU